MAGMAAYRLPEIPHLRLRATFCATSLARLPPFKGSMLRGAFGHALRKAVCAMGPAQPCETCTLRGPYVYTRLFETFRATLLRRGVLGAQAPSSVGRGYGSVPIAGSTR
jgi:hypothetical protein